MEKKKGKSKTKNQSIRKGNAFICKFRDISQKTGLSYGIVKAYYPDMVYIQKMAEYKFYIETGRVKNIWIEA